MWIVFEGLDKSGKGTLELETLKATNFKHIIIDRGPVGYMVFDGLFNRVTKEGDKQFARNIRTMINNKEDFLVVYCHAPADVALKRIEEHNETCPYDYEYAQGLYSEGIVKLYVMYDMNVLSIDTTKPIEECVQMIIKKIQEVSKSECN